MHMRGHAQAHRHTRQCDIIRPLSCPPPPHTYTQLLGEITSKYFYPVLLVLGLLCAGTAAGLYNSGADEVFVP